MDERNNGQTARTEESAEAEMDACKDTIPHITAQVFAALGDDRLIVRKHRHELSGNELCQSGENHTEAHRKNKSASP